MPVEIKVPPVGESVSEGVLARWLKRDGDYVRRDEPVFELESDKATTEVPAPADGILRVAVAEGQTVPIGGSVGRVEEGTAPAANAKPAPAAAEAPAEKAAILSPAAELHAKSKGIDPNQLPGPGSGRGGRFIKEDILAVNPAAEPVVNSVPKPAATAPAPAGTRETRQRMSPLRARIAQRLLESQATTASLTTFNEADLTAINDLRAKYKDKFKEKHGVGLGFSSFFVKAVIEGLKAFPVVNSRIDGDDIVTPHYYNISVAVSTEKGLMVPVLRDADQLTFAGIESGIAELAAKARSGKIAVSDLQGGTFTITNGGIFGSLLSTPILNPPQTGILGMHAIQRRPVAIGDAVVIRPMMNLALTYDHRLIDGREAVQFLVRVKECLEDPHRLMLEI